MQVYLKYQYDFISVTGVLQGSNQSPDKKSSNALFYAYCRLLKYYFNDFNDFNWRIEGKGAEWRVDQLDPQRVPESFQSTEKVVCVQIQLLIKCGRNKIVYIVHIFKNLFTSRVKQTGLNFVWDPGGHLQTGTNLVEPENADNF